MKKAMIFKILSLVGIVATGTSVYTELKLDEENSMPAEITASMYRSLIWHSDVYKNNEFLYTAKHYFSDGMIDEQEYIKLKSLAAQITGPLMYIKEEQNQKGVARLAYKQYLEENALTQVATIN